MSFFDVLPLALRNLREARLRAALTTTGVIVGIAMIVTMVSFGLGLQRNTINRFRALDLFNEITVFGRDLGSLVTAGLEGRLGSQSSSGGQSANSNDSSNANRRESGRNSRTSERTLDDRAVEEIALLPGVASVEPNISITTYLRSNNRVLRRSVSGALVPNQATRFAEFSSGRMLGDQQADEAIVDDKFVRDFGYADAAEAVGKIIELLAPPTENGESDKSSSESLSFFGIPLEESEASTDELVGKSFRVVGVLKTDPANPSGNSRRAGGLLPASNIYIPLSAAREWSGRYRNNLDQVALRLARGSGVLKEGETEGYQSATVRVSDPAILSDVRRRLTEAGFNSFSIVDQLQEIQTVFLILNSALGLLGGISLLVASLGIANTMIMSILERTNEIGIMKAIGAEDREIKLIFFVEAAVIGLTGGLLGTLAAWGIGAAANVIVHRFVLEPKNQNFIDFFALPIWLSLGAVMFAVLIAIAAALYPASRAARIDPVKALRHD